MKQLLGLSAISALLIETASRDLSDVSGAFGLSTGEWTVVTFAGGVVMAVAAALTARGQSDDADTRKRD